MSYQFLWITSTNWFYRFLDPRELEQAQAENGTLHSKKKRRAVPANLMGFTDATGGAWELQRGDIPAAEFTQMVANFSLISTEEGMMNFMVGFDGALYNANYAAELAAVESTSPAGH